MASSEPGPGISCRGAEPDAADKSAAETYKSADEEENLRLNRELDDPQCGDVVGLCALRMRLSDEEGVELFRKYAAKSEVHRLAINTYLNLEQVQSTTPEGQKGKVYTGLQMLLNINVLEE